MRPVSAVLKRVGCWLHVGGQQGVGLLTLVDVGEQPVGRHVRGCKHAPEVVQRLMRLEMDASYGLLTPCSRAHVSINALPLTQQVICQL